MLPEVQVHLVVLQSSHAFSLNGSYSRKENGFSSFVRGMLWNDNRGISQVSLMHFIKKKKTSICTVPE